MRRRLVCGLLFLVVSMAPLIDVAAQKPSRSRRPQRRPDTLEVGDQAADFRLKTLDGKVSVELSKLYNKRPVALVFGSYT